MKKHLLASLLLCLCAAVAPIQHVSAQTASPTPTATPAPVGSVYRNTKRFYGARIADAQAYIAANPNDPAKVEDATYFLDTLTLYTAKSWAPVQALAESMIASNGLYYTGDPTGTRLSQARQDEVFTLAVGAKTALGLQTTADRTAFLLGVFDALPDNVSDAVVAKVNADYLRQVRQQTADYIRAQDYTSAINNALRPELLNSPDLCLLTVQDVLQIKVIQHADDAPSWAKAVYVMGAFADSAQTSILVANAFRSLQGLAVANQFIASQTDEGVTNPLTAVALPDALATGPLPEPKFRSVNLVLRGDAKGAIILTRSLYDTANTNDRLNQTGAWVAAALRNFHGNLIRANQFVASNQPPPTGQPTPAPFVFTELQ